MTKQMGLRAEILVTLSFLLMAALLLGGMLMLRLMEKRLLEERITHLDRLTEIFSMAGDGGDTVRLLRPLRDAADSFVIGWWVYDQSLQLVDLSAPENESSSLGASRRQQAYLSGEIQKRIDFSALLNLFAEDVAVARYVVPRFDEKRFTGLLEVHFSLADIRRHLVGSLQVLLIYVFLYGLVLIAAGYFLLQRNIIRPARILLRATEAVSRGNLKTRLPTTGPQEISQLATAYNRMVEALQHSHAETREHIEALQQTNRDLQQARHELIRSEKMAATGQLAAGLAHELGNPLAALIGYLEILKQSVQAMEDQDIVERSLTETMRIDFLVRELLNFARPQSLNFSEDVDLSAELRAGCLLLGHQGNLSAMDIVDLLPESLPPITINRQKIQQVLINLLLNAVQACAGTGKILLTGGVGSDGVWIGIRDDGCGIEQNDLTRIFDPFYTTKEPGAGTGLGLTICHRIVEESGGRIEVLSEPGQGTEFRLFFR